MLRKYVLLGILMITSSLGLMGFSSASYQPKVNNLVSIIDPGMPQFYQYGPAILATGFARPTAVISEGPQFYQYGPAILATGFARPAAVISEGPQFYQYGPAILATGFARPAVTSLQTRLSIRQLENYNRFGFARPGSTSLQTPHFYQYGPAILATGFARPK
jgi:hypothetical protein